MSKAEIIAELAQLSPKDLADVRAWIEGVARDNSFTETGRAAIAATHIRTPRLADPSHAADFKKQVT